VTSARSFGAAAWCSWSAPIPATSSGRDDIRTIVSERFWGLCLVQDHVMPRLMGVDIPSEKKTIFSLQYIYGVGPRVARELCQKAGVDPLAQARNLHEDELARIATLLDKDYVVEGQLRRQVAQDIARLKDVGSYRGLRHRRGLPVRGQRTRTNARTRKGPKKTVAGKKGVKDLK
jgi:small subunit ribosomal protein S13